MRTLFLPNNENRLSLKKPTSQPEQTKQTKFQIVMNTCQKKQTNRKNDHCNHNPQQRCTKRTNSPQARIFQKKSTFYKFVKWLEILKSPSHRRKLHPHYSSSPYLTGMCRSYRQDGKSARNPFSTSITLQLSSY